VLHPLVIERFGKSDDLGAVAVDVGEDLLDELLSDLDAALEREV